MLLEKIEELLKEVNALTAQNAEEVEQLRQQSELEFFLFHKNKILLFLSCPLCGT